MLTYYETDRLILKIVSPDYCHSVLHFYSSNQSVFQQYDPTYPDNYYTPDYQRSSLSYEYNSFLEGKSVRYYIFRKESPLTIIGTISFTNILYGNYQSASVGYKFDRMHQHQGYATESLQKGIYVMFYEMGLHRLEAFIMPSNLPSKRLIERLGFTYEGMTLESAYIQNQWKDHELYSLLSRPTSLHQ